MIKFSLAITISAILFVGSSAGVAGLHVEGDPQFKAHIEANLLHAKQLSPHLKRLIEEVEASYMLVTITPITNDPSTWHSSGDKTRSHCAPLDKKPRGVKRDYRSSSTIFINPLRVNKAHRSYRSGVLMHELGHGLDLAKGNYHGDYQFRERRAVVFQNIWRASIGHKLRTTYADRFSTLEYQVMEGDDEAITSWIDYYLENPDLP